MEKMDDRRFRYIQRFLERYNRIQAKVKRRTERGKSIGSFVQNMLLRLERKHETLCIELASHDLSEVAPDFLQEHAEEFWMFSITDAERRANIANGYRITLADIKRYSLIGKNGFDYQKYSGESYFNNEKDLVDRFGIDIVKYINLGILDSAVLSPEFLSKIQSIVDSIEPGTEIDETDDRIKQANIEFVLSSLDNNTTLLSTFYNNPEIRRLMPEYFIETEDENLRKAFFDRILSLEDISRNPDVFQGKKVIWAMRYNDRSYFNNKGIDDERFIFFRENFMSIIEGFDYRMDYNLISLIDEIDLSKSQEENIANVNAKFSERARSDYPYVYFKSRPFADSIEVLFTNKEIWRRILEKYGEEKLMSFPVPFTFFMNCNERVAQILEQFGLDNLVEIFEANNNSSQTNNSNINNFFHNIERLYIIAGIRDGNNHQFSDGLLDSFKALRPDLFLDDSAPAFLKTHYYSEFSGYDGGMKLEYLFDSEYMPFLEGKSFDICVWSSEQKRIVDEIGIKKATEFISTDITDNKKKSVQTNIKLLEIMSTNGRSDFSTQFEKLSFITKNYPGVLRAIFYRYNSDYLNHNDLSIFLEIIDAVELEKSDEENIDTITKKIEELSSQHELSSNEVFRMLPFSKINLNNIPELNHIENVEEIKNLIEQIINTNRDEDIFDLNLEYSDLFKANVLKEIAFLGAPNIVRILQKYNITIGKFADFSVFSELNFDELEGKSSDELFSILDNVFLKEWLNKKYVPNNRIPYSSYYKAIEAENEEAYAQLEQIYESSNDKDISILERWSEDHRIGFLNSDFRRFVYTFGVDTILEFERNNHQTIQGMLLERVYAIMASNGFLEKNAEFSEDKYEYLQQCMIDFVQSLDNGYEFFKNSQYSNEFTDKYIDKYLRTKIENQEKREEVKNILLKYGMKYIAVLFNEHQYGKEFKQLDLENLDAQEIERIVLHYIKLQIQNTKDNEFRPKVIKEGIPELFISDDADEAIKNAFYNHTLTIGHLSTIEGSQLFVDKDYYTSKRIREIMRAGDDIYIGHENEFLIRVNYGIQNSSDDSEKKRYLDFIGSYVKNQNKIEIEPELISFLSGFPFKYFAFFNQMDLSKLQKHIDNPQKLRMVFFELVKCYIDEGNIILDSKGPDSEYEEISDYFLGPDAPERIQKFFCSKRLNSNEHMRIRDLFELDEIGSLKGKQLGAAFLDHDLRYYNKLLGSELLIYVASLDRNEDGLLSDDETKRLEDEKKYIYDAINSIGVEELCKKISSMSDFLVRKKMCSELGISVEDFEKRLDEDDFKSQYELEIISIKKQLIHYPIMVSIIPESKYEGFDLQKFKELVKKSRFDFEKERTVVETVISKMYCLLGYEGCLETFELPDIDEDRLDSLITLSEEITKKVYEEKYQIIGKAPLVSDFFKSLSILAPDNAGKENGSKVKSKKTQAIFRAINEKLTNGYDGNLESLIQTIFEELEFPLNEGLKSTVLACVLTQHTEYKLEQIERYNSGAIERKILGENTRTKQYLLAFLRSAIETSLLSKEKLDIDFVKKFLESKFGEKTEEGFPRYSEHITSHLDDLLSICEDLNNGEYSELLNQNVMDLIISEKSKIGARWIGKLLDLPDSDEKLSVDEYNAIEERIYGAESENEFETRMVIGLIDSSPDGIKRAYDLLVSNGVENVLTLRKAEQMFGALSEPYSEEFKNFFLEHRDVFIANLTYNSEINRIHREFDRIINDFRFADKYKKGILSIDEIIEEAKLKGFHNIEKGDYELAYVGVKYGKFDQKMFDRAKELQKEMRQREVQSIPPAYSKKTRYRGRVLRIDDPLHFGVGEATDCCQHIFGVGEDPMIHSATSRNGAVFVIEQLNEFGEPVELVAQSWVWRNGDRICFDNVEVKPALIRDMKKNGEMDEVLDIYIEAAREMIDLDNRALRKLLELGRITEREFEILKISEVTVGVNGCDDLIKNISPERKKLLETASIISPYNYSGYSDSRDLQHVFAINPEKKTIEHQDMDVTEYGLGYTKLREVQVRKNTDINPDILEKIIKLNEAENRECAIFTEVSEHSIYDFFEALEENRMSDHDDIIMHYSELGDWYILARENDDTVKIEDSLVGTQFDLEDPMAKMDKMMSFSEYTKELLSIISKANKQSKTIILNKQREGRFGVLDKLIEEKIIALNDGVVTVENQELLDEAIKRLEEDLKKQFEERALSDVGRKNNNDGEIQSEQNDVER